MNLLVIDIGGTSIKYGHYVDEQLTKLPALKTPTTYGAMKEQFAAVHEQVGSIDGVAISSPGSVDVTTGIIHGLSAVPYIHNFEIRKELEALFQVPVTIQNDANCAALAEVWQGNAKDVIDSAFFIIGTGIGGAVVMDRKLRAGKHLFGGEFGYALTQGINGPNLSQAASTGNTAKWYSEKKADGTDYDGRAVFDKAQAGDALAKQAVERFYNNLAVGVFNLAIHLDPERVLIGGAISQRPELITELQAHVEAVIKAQGADGLAVDLAPCKFQNDANMLGAVYQFMTEQEG